MSSPHSLLYVWSGFFKRAKYSKHWPLSRLFIPSKGHWKKHDFENQFRNALHLPISWLSQSCSNAINPFGMAHIVARRVKHTKLAKRISMEAEPTANALFIVVHTLQTSESIFDRPRLKVSNVIAIRWCHTYLYVENKKKKNRKRSMCKANVIVVKTAQRSPVPPLPSNNSQMTFFSSRFVLFRFDSCVGWFFFSLWICLYIYICFYQHEKKRSLAANAKKQKHVIVEYRMPAKKQAKICHRMSVSVLCAVINTLHTKLQRINIGKRVITWNVILDCAKSQIRSQISDLTN